MSMPSIVLPPSDSQDALVNAIAQAITTNANLLLEPGVHYTRPGLLQRIAVGANGLRIGSTGPSPLPITSTVEKACIRRPDHAILPATPDSNFGLFFIPTEPTDEEVAKVTWKPSIDSVGPFEY